MFLGFEADSAILYKPIKILYIVLYQCKIPNKNKNGRSRHS